MSVYNNINNETGMQICRQINKCSFDLYTYACVFKLLCVGSLICNRITCAYLSVIMVKKRYK